MNLLLLKQTYNQNSYLNFIADKFKFKKFIQAIDDIDNNDVKSFQQLGTITTHDDKELPVFEIYIKPNTQLSRNRVQLRNLVAKQIYIEDGALAVYIDTDNQQWRFSFIAIEYSFSDEGIKKEQTASKRFTYLFGENTKTRTAEKRFKQLNNQSTLQDLKEAFAVEALNKEFYDKLYRWYEKAHNQVTFPNDEKMENHIQTSLIRLLTRLLFIWFIKEKKLINPDLFDQEKLQNLIDYNQPSSFYKAILQNLFFATLNVEINKRDFRDEEDSQGANKDYGNQYRYRYHALVKNKEKWESSFAETPFLNGGLFESLDRKLDRNNANDKKWIDEWNVNTRPEKSMVRMEGFSEHKKNPLKISNQLFFNNDKNDLGLIDLFNQYQFTVEESTPLDIEVALDPELLGKVFENLLASYNPETGQQARKATGSFYTPREIVNYMVDESLKAYLIQAMPPDDGNTKLYQKRLTNLFAASDNTGKLAKDNGISLIYPNEIPKLITAISQIKIIDLAVGSGAFPMGLLQRMTALLAILDPDNKQWKEQKLAELPNLQSIEADLKTSAQISDTNAKQQAQQILNDKKQNIIRAFENQDHNYLRKLYLIENCIYGVDIQSIAIQICKLRFFISLTIEQTPNQDKTNNYTIKALPNLETKFIVANSLLPLGEMPKQKGIFDTGIEELQTKLAQVRHKHFSAKTLTTKRKYREQDKSLHQEMLYELINNPDITKGVVASMKKIIHWDLYNQNAIADWFDPEWMFGVKNGFDIVIGNPPYIRQESIKAFKPQFKKAFSIFAGTADIYTYFYEKGVNLLSSNGHLCYITSNKWMRAKYGENLRGFFKEKTQLKQIIDFEGEQIFENVTVDTNILLCGKALKTQSNFAYQKQLPTSKNADKNPLFNMAIADLSKNAYTLQVPKILALKNKIERIGIPLKDWDIRINYGIKTGLNEAFIINTAKRDELIAADPNSAEIIKPILRGRDIKAYEHHWAGLWIINSHNGDKDTVQININDYPAIKNHLDQYYPQLEKRQDKGITPYNLRSCAYHTEFTKEKIVYSEIVKESQFYFDDKNYYVEATAFVMSGENLKFLIALLHAKLITYAFKMFYSGGGLGKEGYRYKKVFLEQLPIPRISKPAQQPFIELVDKILIAKQQAQDTTTLETQINQMVYKLYHLTTNEINIIKGAK